MAVDRPFPKGTFKIELGPGQHEVSAIFKPTQSTIVFSRTRPGELASEYQVHHTRPGQFGRFDEAAVVGAARELALALQLFQLGRVRARACARYGVLVVGEEMKGLVNCNFLPGSARRLELGTVSAEPLSRAYWSQKLRPLGETVGLSRARTSGESPDSTQAGRGPQWPIQLAAISAHPAAMVGTGMPKLRGRTGNEP
jgi:hypothetical protein